MKKKGYLTLLLYILMTVLGTTLMIMFSSCVSRQDVINQYHKGGVKPTGKSELKRKQIKISRTS